MHRLITTRLLAVLLLAGPWVGGCAVQPSSAREQRPLPPEQAPSARGVREELDEERGTNLTIMANPLVMARPRTDVAANVRDYVTLITVQEENSGKYGTWLVAHQWSTVDPRMPAAGWHGSGRLILFADGRVLSFDPASPAPDVLQRRAWLFAPALVPARSYAYVVDIATLRYLAAAREIAARFDGDPMPQSYSIWQDGRAALRRWLENVAQ